MPPPWHLVLEVSPDADAATVKSAFRRLALAHHPDRDPEGFERVSAAYGAWLATQPPDTKPAAPPPTQAELDQIVGQVQALLRNPSAMQQPPRRRSHPWLLWAIAAAILAAAALALVGLRQ